MRTKISKFSKFYRIIFSIFLLFFLIFLILNFSPSPKILSEVKCKKILENQQSCVFNCSIITNKYENFFGRAIVTHSGWASIYDEVFNFTHTTSLLIELPKRNYNYVMRIGIKGEGSFDSIEQTLFC